MTQDQSYESHIAEVGRIAAGFETQWKSGIRPRVAEFVTLASGPARHSVLLELIGIGY